MTTITATFNLPCMCCNVLQKAIKKIKQFREKHTYYIMYISCVSANVEFAIRNIPLEGEIPDVNMPRGKSWGILHDSNEELAYSMLLKIPK